MVWTHGSHHLAGLKKPLVVVPFHDPSWLANTLDNVQRQALQLPALLVLNGKARRIGTTGGLLATESLGNDHSSAVNAGWSWALEHGFDSVVLFDSDDYYGPFYTEKITQALEQVDFCGQRQVFTRMQDGSIHLMDRPGRSFVFATVGFRVASFRAVAPGLLDNCWEWSQRMTATGCSSLELGPLHYCYFRHGRNAHWNGRIPDACVREVWGPSLRFETTDVEVCHRGIGPSTFCPRPTTAEIFEALGRM